MELCIKREITDDYTAQNGKMISLKFKLIDDEKNQVGDTYELYFSDGSIDDDVFNMHRAAEDTIIDKLKSKINVFLSLKLSENERRNTWKYSYQTYTESCILSILSTSNISHFSSVYGNSGDKFYLYVCTQYNIKNYVILPLENLLNIIYESEYETINFNSKYFFIKLFVPKQKSEKVYQYLHGMEYDIYSALYDELDQMIRCDEYNLENRLKPILDNFHSYIKEIGGKEV